MKILVISDDLPPRSFGGAGIVAYSQFLELEKRGHIVKAITGVEKDSAEEIMREFLPDITHAHNLHQSLSYGILPLARKYSKKVFLTAHDAMLVHYGKIYPKVHRVNGEVIFDYRISSLHQLRYFWNRWKPFRNARIRRYLRHVDKIISVSQALKDALEQNGLSNIVVAHNGIDVEGLKVTDKAIDDFRKKHNLVGKSVMLFGGRLGRAKGGDVALNLLIDLREMIPDVCLLVAGKGDSYTEELRKRANDAGVSNNLVLTGWLGRDEMAVAYNASHLVLTLSTYLDPFPTVNLEAMAASRPVLGTFFGGTPELVEDNVTGFVVDPRDREQVSQKAKEILSNVELARSFGQAGYGRVKDRFSITRTVDDLERIYSGSF